MQDIREEQAINLTLKFPLGTDNLPFNHYVQVDTMFIGESLIMQMADFGTHLCAAVFLKNQSTLVVWKAVQRLWDLSCMGPPDQLIVEKRVRVHL